jgi:hypothetical protein
VSDRRKREKAGSVPRELYWLFWDVDAKSLDPRRYKKYVIERTLEFGNEAAYRWLFQTFADEDIIEVVKNSRRISRRTAVMMANFYGLPETEVRCLRGPAADPPGRAEQEKLEQELKEGYLALADVNRREADAFLSAQAEALKQGRAKRRGW